MPLFKLNEALVDRLATWPEIGMGLHIVALPEPEQLPHEVRGPSRLGFIVGDRVLLTDDERTIQEISELLAGERWLSRASQRRDADVIGLFERWIDGLPSAPTDLMPLDRNALLLRGLFPIGPKLAMPVPPKIIYGHLPFHSVVGGTGVFYRYEPFPSSRRIDQATGDVRPGTFACPASEAPLVPSGFAAVGRFALPNLLPACFRWELQPQPGTAMRCGASVPLYGQAGGGVEVCFDKGLKNRGPIANPVVLPVL